MVRTPLFARQRAGSGTGLCDPAVNVACKPQRGERLFIVYSGTASAPAIELS